MRRRLVLAAFPLALALSLGSEARACMITTAVETEGRRVSESERRRDARAQARRAARERLARWSAAAEAALAGGYDISGALAEILVPNIRPVPIRPPQSCGSANEIDQAAGDEDVEDWLAGTGYEAWARTYDLIGPSWEGETFGPACNAEIRTRFADLLRRRLSEERRRDAYLFLAARIPHWKGDPQPLRPVGHFSYETTGIGRLVAFAGETRQLPIRWLPSSSGEQGDIARWLREHPSGVALQAAMDEFWRENGPLLDANESACPAALARWPSVQAQIVVPIEEAIARNVPEPRPR
jgi:hypothetical protein